MLEVWREDGGGYRGPEVWSCCGGDRGDGDDGIYYIDLLQKVWSKDGVTWKVFILITTEVASLMAYGLYIGKLQR